MESASQTFESDNGNLKNDEAEIVVVEDEPKRVGSNKKRKRVQNTSESEDSDLSEFLNVANKKHADMIAMAKSFGLDVSEKDDINTLLDRLDSLPVTKSGCIKEDYIVDDDEVESSLEEDSESSVEEISDDEEGDTLALKRQRMRQKLQRELEILEKCAESYKLGDNDDHSGRAAKSRYRLRRAVTKPVTKIDMFESEAKPIEASKQRSRLLAAQKREREALREERGSEALRHIVAQWIRHDEYHS